MTLCGALWAGVMVLFSPSAFGWLTPAWLGLVAAAPLVKYSSSGTWGGVVSHRLGLLHTPSISLKPALLKDFADLTARSPAALNMDGDLTLNIPPSELYGDMPCQLLRPGKSSQTSTVSRAKEPH
jgi:membrane glycosyltransferase